MNSYDPFNDNDSTLNPIVGIVVTIGACSGQANVYKIVVFPAEPSPCKTTLYPPPFCFLLKQVMLRKNALVNPDDDEIWLPIVLLTADEMIARKVITFMID